MRGEPLTWQLAVGGVLVGLGIYLVASGKAEADRRAQAGRGPAVPAEANP